ncbi:hypothetical protein [Vallitalea okinawensis]|uniref:hypothetical protein n=1 Tax=Vallitalea okinawensis TaxID=2078660 RepID=UPI000CFA9937|nr:hypothetical protein [Vallitalea okinawensis]
MKLFEKIFGNKQSNELKIDYNNELNKIEFRYNILKKYSQQKNLVISIETNLMDTDKEAVSIINGLADALAKRNLPFIKMPTVSNRKKSIYGIDIGNKNGTRDIAYILICQIEGDAIDWQFFCDYLSHSDLIIGVNPLLSFDELKDYLTLSYALNFPESDKFQDYIYDSKNFHVFRTSIKLEN